MCSERRKHHAEAAGHRLCRVDEHRRKRIALSGYCRHLPNQSIHRRSLPRCTRTRPGTAERRDRRRARQGEKCPSRHCHAAGLRGREWRRLWITILRQAYPAWEHIVQPLGRHPLEALIAGCRRPPPEATPGWSPACPKRASASRPPGRPSGTPQRATPPVTPAARPRGATGSAIRA